VALVAAVGYVTHLVARSAAGRNMVDVAAGRQATYLTLTVLPFESLGDGGEQAYLARGISNDLMTDLSRLPGLRLIAASRAAPDGAAKARYLVSGSVQREAETLRINVRLIDTGSGQQLWSERYERPYGDLFKVQDELTRKLTQVLPGKLSDAVRQRLARPYTRSLEAYDDFLRGQALFLVRRSEDNEQARDFYRKALELDPNFARAYAGLAMTYAMDYRLRPTGGSSPALARASELAESARQIDPEIPEVYWALAFVDAQSRRHRKAIESLQRAIDLNPSYADAYALMGGIYTYIGQPAKSIPLLRTAMHLNPDGGHLYFLLLGRAYLFEHDAEQALINLRQASARNPADLETRLYLAAALVAAEDRPDAEWEADQIRTVDPGFALPRWLESYPLTDARESKELRGLLALAGL
ncbi:MAG: tetratricopeptide repeat protein, partial [Burkholderiales bacterium]